jgi:predicted O-methyltransferase YrrM
MIKQLIKAIQESESHGLSETPPLFTELTGFSSKKLLGVLQRFSKIFEGQENTCYLEIGVFQGLTLCLTSLSSKNFACYGIDNFAFFDPDKKNLSIVEERLAKLELNNAFIVNQDYEDALENLGNYIGNKKIGVYFIDGPHDYRSQLMCLELALPYLHDQAAIIIDDSNYRHVRQANRDFLITHPEYKLLFEAYTSCHPSNMSKDEEQEAMSGWWDGVNIIVRDKDQTLSPMYPETERSRILYENEHIVHASQLAELTPQSIDLLQHLYEGNFLRFIVNSFKLYRLLRREKSKYGNRFKWTNTYSNKLTTSKFNLPNPS